MVGFVPASAAADAPAAADVVPADAGMGRAESAGSAVSGCWPVSQSLSPELIVCRLPRPWLPRPVSPGDPDEPTVRPFALPIVSAGSGTLLVDSASTASSSTVCSTTGSLIAVPLALASPATGSSTTGSSTKGSSTADAVSAAAAVATLSDVTVSSASSEVAVSPEEPEEEESPLLAPSTGRDAPERELPALFRDDDITPLSTIVSVVSPTGSTFRLGGAMMSGG